jgi:DNA-binding XRE family transcriptional regulator
MNALRKSLLQTKTSAYPVNKRFGFPHSEINPSTEASNVMFIVDSVISDHLPRAYTEIDDVIAKSERNPQRAAALARARGRMAGKLNESGAPVTLASLRLRAGLSQAKVASLIGNSQSSYSLIESGQRGDIFLSTSKKLASLFGVSLDVIDEAIENSKQRT